MNKTILILALLSAILLSCCSPNVASSSFVDVSSVDAFFRMADKLASGKQPSDKEWNKLFETQGYKKCIDETFHERGEFTRNAMNLAYSPAKVAERDSLMKIPVIDMISDWEALLQRVMLQNFLDMKTHQPALQEQLRAMDFNNLQDKARQRLKSFLVNPVDSLVTTIPVSLVCMEPDALSLSGRIVWDCNLFYKQTEEARVDLLAHEMFHAYRRHFVDERRASSLLKIIYLWHNEGIADLIDKKTLSDLSSEYLRYGFPQEYVESYNEMYHSTPRTLKDLENLTLSFLRNDITEKDFNLKLSAFGQYGGHPNGYYMSTLIKNAGFEKELIGTFDSPVEFMKLYNKSVDKEYKLSDEFMNYIEKIK